MKSLPPDKAGTKKKISDLLSPHDVSNLAITNRHNAALFQPEIKVSRLLRAVVQGEQDMVRDLLTNDLALFLGRGRTTDYSGRIFEDVTAFQLALWAKDHHMLSTMINSIPNSEQGNEIRNKLLIQYKEWKDQGISYTMPLIEYVMGGQAYTVGGESHSRHYTIEPLLQSLRFLQEIDPDDWKNMIKDHWCSVVGSLQSTLPAQMMKEYCSGGEPEPTFMFYHKRKIGEPDGCIYPLSTQPGSRLGQDFALLRQETSRAYGVTGDPNAPPYPNLATIQNDLSFLTDLNKVRDDYLMEIKTLLRPKPLEPNRAP